MRRTVILAAAFVVASAGAALAQTSAPASATIPVGTYAADVIGWVAAVFSVPLGYFMTQWLSALAKKAGVQVSDTMRSQIQEMVENGLAVAAHDAQTRLDGKLDVTVRNDLVASAVVYAQKHGAETIKALGIDPNDPKATEALRARASAALNKIAPPASV